MHSETIDAVLEHSPVAEEVTGAKAPVSPWTLLKQQTASASPGLINDMAMLEKWFDRSDVEEIKINRPGQIEIQTTEERFGIDDPNITFDWCMRFANRLAAFSKQGVSEQKPILYATLPTGDRCTVLIPPAVLQGTVAITIRREFPLDLTIDDYERDGAFTMVRDMTDSELLPHELELLNLKNTGQFAEFFRKAIEYRLNGLISGGSGAGKTTLLKAFKKAMPPKRRLGSIENVDELKLRLTHRDSVAMFYSMNSQGVSSVSAGDLMGSCMRQRFDSVYLAELIAPNEAFYFLDSVGTDMPGCWSTTHANTTSGAIDRIISLVRRSDEGRSMTADEIRKLVFKSVDVIVQFKIVNGKRGITEIYYDPAYKRSLETAR